MKNSAEDEAIPLALLVAEIEATTGERCPDRHSGASRVGDRPKNSGSSSSQWPMGVPEVRTTKDHHVVAAGSDLLPSLKR